MTQTNTTPRLYVGTYAKYNNGSIEGAWLNLTDYSTAEEFLTACRELHKDEEDPELMFQDFEGFPRRLYSECGNVEEIFEYLEKLQEVGEDNAEAYEAYVNAGFEPDNFEEAYQGEWSSEEAFAENIIDECYDLEKMMSNLSSYFDYERFARDLFMSDYTMIDGFVFRADI